MRVIKSLNNNVALALDDAGDEVVIFGNGVGFPSMPYELEDASRVRQVFRSVDASSYAALSSITESVMQAALDIVEDASSCIASKLSPNVALTLADHLQFAVERVRRGICLTNPLADEIAFVYPLETAVGRRGLKTVRVRTGVALPNGEAASIGIHLVNAEVGDGEDAKSMSDVMTSTRVIERVVTAMECQLGMTVDRSSYNYVRFVMHLRYLIVRLLNNEGASDSRTQVGLLAVLAADDADTYRRAKAVANVIAQEIEHEVCDDELLYLFMYIKRLQSV